MMRKNIFILLICFILFNQSYSLASIKQTREEIFRKLTKNTWCIKYNDRMCGNGSSLTKYQFLPDGNFKYSFNMFGDSNPDNVHKWNFKEENNQWYVIFDTGEQKKISFNQDKLVLDEKLFDACELINSTNTYAAQTLPPIHLSEATVNIIKILTANKWNRTNDFNAEFLPTSVEFKDNFEYITTYRHGECQNKGTWALNFSNQITSTSKTNDCDNRPGNTTFYPESFSVKIEPNSLILFNDQKFIPENQSLSRGSFTIFTYREVTIKVEYDYPIKKGVPNRFDVEVQNTEHNNDPTPLTLQRFSVTKDLVWYKRINKLIVKSDQEIAAINLGEKVLNRMDTYRFSLNVTFNKTGKQSIYINNLAYTSRQAFDSRQYFSINVE